MAERKDHADGDRPFLSRWSERKRHAEPDPPGRPQSDDGGQDRRTDAATAPEQQAANRAAAEAIDIDSLTADSDYSPFFRDGVPAALKSAALRQLWRSSPVFANVDGLNDYDEDFTIPKTPVGVIRTAWKFGRGFVGDDDNGDESGGADEDRQTAEAGKDDEETAEAAAGGPDTVSDDGGQDEPAPDAQPADPAAGPSQSSAAAGVALRDRLDMAAFDGRDDD